MEWILRIPIKDSRGIRARMRIRVHPPDLRSSAFHFLLCVFAVNLSTARVNHFVLPAGRRSC
jgi:hypothetical protein